MRIAVISAYPHRLNPGMITVDRALVDVLQDAGVECELDFYCLEAAVTLELGYIAIDYRKLESAGQLEPYDRIVFWGDFLHWKNYVLRDIVPRMTAAGGPSPDDVVDSWYRLIMLEGRPDLRAKSVIFGSSVYALDASSLSDRRYGDALTALYRDARLVRLRDVVSAGFAAQLVGDGRDYFGCDCAFFLKPRDPLEEAGIARPGYIACAFGRSVSTLLHHGFAELLSELTGKELLDLGWLAETRPKEIDRRISEIRKAAFVVTDVYHVAVTSLREGTPVVCLARGTAVSDTTLSDKKKEILMNQHFAARGLLHQENLHLASSNDKAVHSLARICLAAIGDSDYQAAVTENLNRHVARQRGDLHTAIFGK